MPPHPDSRLRPQRDRDRTHQRRNTQWLFAISLRQVDGGTLTDPTAKPPQHIKITGNIPDEQHMNYACVFILDEQKYTTTYSATKIITCKAHNSPCLQVKRCCFWTVLSNTRLPLVGQTDSPAPNAHYWLRQGFQTVSAGGPWKSLEKTSIKNIKINK